MIEVYNKQDDRNDRFTPEEAMDWLETIGLHAAHEMYAKEDVARLMNFAK